MSCPDCPIPPSTGCTYLSTGWPRDDHRLRLEHVGAIHYWGDIIVDGIFGPEHGNRWMPCASAVATGMRISLHNDPPVTPEERATYLAGRQVYPKED